MFIRRKKFQKLQDQHDKILEDHMRSLTFIHKIEYKLISKRIEIIQLKQKLIEMHEINSKRKTKIKNMQRTHERFRKEHYALVEEHQKLRNENEKLLKQLNRRR